MNKRKFRFDEKCPICGHKNPSVYWYDADFISYSYSTPNSSYLCHWCGYFYRQFGDREIIDGLTLNPEKVMPKQQLKAFRKYRRLLEEIPLSFKSYD